MNDRDTWQTPQDLWDELNKQYSFNFDCCADNGNQKTTTWTNDFESNTIIPSESMCWMNPPFSKAYQMFKHFFKVVKEGVAIYRCDNMETKVWQDVIFKNATWIAIPKGRINYKGFEGNSARFGSALIGFNVEPPKLENWTVLRTA